MALIKSFRGKKPKFGDNCWFAENATIVGDVTMGKNCTVWFNTVVRGDVHSIAIGDNTNIQDGAVIHGTYQKAKTVIGSGISIGHNAVIHGCTLEDDVLIGMGAIVMDGVVVGEESIVGAGSLLTPGTEVPPRSLVHGRPARVVRKVTDDEVENFIMFGVRSYLEYKESYPRER